MLICSPYSSVYSVDLFTGWTLNMCEDKLSPIGWPARFFSSGAEKLISFMFTGRQSVYSIDPFTGGPLILNTLTFILRCLVLSIFPSSFVVHCPDFFHFLLSAMSPTHWGLGLGSRASLVSPTGNASPKKDSKVHNSKSKGVSSSILLFADFIVTSKGWFHRRYRLRLSSLS